MDDYTLMERQFFENKLLKELNDFESISRRNSGQIQNNGRPSSYNRGYIRERLQFSRENTTNRQAEKVIITKSGKTRVLRDI